MNKIFIVVCIIGIFLTGCSEITDVELAPVHELFSTDENKYSILYVDETGKSELNHEWMDKHEIKNVKKINGRDSLEDTANNYKFLELEKSPAYVVFDTKDIVFKTNSEEELIDFLTNNNPN